jgi:hypothetical protein
MQASESLSVLQLILAGWDIPLEVIPTMELVAQQGGSVHRLEGAEQAVGSGGLVRWRRKHSTGLGPAPSRQSAYEPWLYGLLQG